MGIIQDPICNMAVSPDKAKFHMNYANQEFYFCSEKCFSKFKKSPATYVSNSKKTLRQQSQHASCVYCSAGKHIPSIDYTDGNVPLIDRYLHYCLSNVYGISPGSIATACFDWWFHLSLSPGKQIELMSDAFEKAILFSNYLTQKNTGEEEKECCIQPLPQDRRFIDEEWKQWPFNIYQQYFLLIESWWQKATSSVRGVTQHHSDVVPFLTRQLLDTFSPLNYPMTNPRVVNAIKEKGGMNLIQGAQNYINDMLRDVAGQLPIGAENYIVGQDVACTKGKVIYQNNLIELIQYLPVTDEAYSEPILIVPAWIMKYYILDLSPNNSLVKFLVDKGHTVFMISWKNPNADDRNISFTDYLHLGVMEAINVVQKIVPDQKIHATGYCLGGTILAIAAAHMAKAGNDILKTITLFAAQVDFEEAGELSLFIDESQLAYLEDIMWQQGYLDTRRMAGTFYMLRSYDLLWSRIVENYMLGKNTPVNDLMAWNADATRMPYKMHSEYLRGLFLNNDLCEGRFKVDDKTMALSDIKSPFFVVGTQRDHVAPWKSVYKINLYTDTDVTFLLTSGGHNAGIVSEPGHEHRSFQIHTKKHKDNYIPADQWIDLIPITEGSWWPEWESWLVEHSTGKNKPPKMGKAICDAPGKYVEEK